MTSRGNDLIVHVEMAEDEINSTGKAENEDSSCTSSILSLRY